MFISILKGAAYRLQQIMERETCSYSRSTNLILKTKKNLKESQHLS